MSNNQIFKAHFTLIHTDGGCSPNPGEGAYVAILQNGDKAAAVRGYAPYATNQQMELAAVIAGLSALKSTRIPVHLVTDSQYVHDGATSYLKSWRNNGWQTSKGTPLANLELWQELDPLLNRFVIAWFKVSGHSGVEFNVKADHLVQDTRQAQGDSTRYRETDLPTLASPWVFTQFQAQYVRPDQVARRGQVAHLRKQFAGILTKWPAEAKGPQ